MELALVLPFLLILLVLLVQYSILMNTAVSITNMTREGARYAVVAHASDSDIKNRIYQVLPPSISKPDIDNNSLITPAETDPNRNKQETFLTVTISYTMANKLFVPTQFFGISFFPQTYTVHTTMMVQ
jgi:Flp pilus assembly protein TadG